MLLSFSAISYVVVKKTKSVPGTILPLVTSVAWEHLFVPTKTQTWLDMGGLGLNAGLE